MSSVRESLAEDINQLFEQDLPEKAKKEGSYPVVYGHCFRRLAYDNACEGHWKDKVPPPFIKNAPIQMLVRVLKCGNHMFLSSVYAHKLQDKSLRFRGHKAV